MLFETPSHPIGEQPLPIGPSPAQPGDDRTTDTPPKPRSPTMRRPLIALTAVAASGTLALSACAGGSSDVVAQPGSTAAGAAATSTINLYAYAVPKVAFDVLIPAFQKTDGRQGRAVPAELRRLGRPEPQGRRRRRGRLRQLLGRARRHPPRRRRPRRRQLERQRAQGDSLRLGRHHRRAQGQPQGHQGLGRPAPARHRGRHAQPVLVGLGEVEPPRAVCRQERGRHQQGRRPRLRHRPSSRTT